MRNAFIPLALLLLGACQMTPREPLTLAQSVDIPRFMGDWYVIAAIPTPFERQAYNALETYRLESRGTVATTFRYNKGAPDGPQKTLKATGFVREGSSGAVWGMQFIWPFKADYRVMYVSDSYNVTVIGRQARDYLWIMARTPSLSETRLQQLLAFCESQGYDLSELRRIPHA